MANLYLSFLGTSNYVPCTYTHGDDKIAEVRFVQEATISVFCRDWTASDRILIFVTGEAEKKNWRDGGYYDDAGKEINGLGSRLAGLKLKPPIESVPIPEGSSEQEIWQIFQIIYNQIKPGDRIIFDITHAFRSIPMLAMVVLPYARVMKNIAIGGIYYGAFEVLGHPARVKELPMEQRLAPVFDLTPFSSLLDWTLAIDRFLGAGDAVPACQLAKHAVTPILRETQGQDQAAAAIRRVTSLLESFSKQMSTCRGRDIPQTIAELQQALIRCHDQRLLLPLQPLLDLIKQRLAVFQDSPVHNGVQAAHWCLDHNLIQQGYTILQETLITFFVLQVNNDPSHRRHRELAGQAVAIYLDDIDRAAWHHPAANYPETIMAHIAFLRNNRELAKILKTLSQDRNDLNHAGYISPISAEAFASRLANFLKQVEENLP